MLYYSTRPRRSRQITTRHPVRARRIARTLAREGHAGVPTPEPVPYVPDTKTLMGFLRGEKMRARGHRSKADRRKFADNLAFMRAVGRGQFIDPIAGEALASVLGIDTSVDPNATEVQS